MEAQHLLGRRGPQPLVGVLAGGQLCGLRARELVAHFDDGSDRRPRQTCDLCQNHHALGPALDHHVLRDRHRYVGQCGDRGVGLVEFPCRGERCQLTLVQPSVLVKSLDQRVGDLGILGDRRSGRARETRRLLHHARDSGRLLRVGGFQPLANRVRSFCQKLQVEMPRHRRTKADAGGEIVITFGAVDETGEAAFGEFRARIVHG